MLANGSIAIGICDRCHMKRPYVELQPDGDIPGLRVCAQGCRDDKDPYKMPPRQPDPLSMRYPRPDEPLVVPDDKLIVTQSDEPIDVNDDDGELAP